MDDLLLFTQLKRSHMDKLEDLLKVLLKNGLKISPRKCQLFRTNLQYMGNEIFIQNKRFLCETIEMTSYIHYCRLKPFCIYMYAGLYHYDY